MEDIVGLELGIGHSGMPKSEYTNEKKFRTRPEEQGRCLGLSNFGFEINSPGF